MEMNKKIKSIILLGLILILVPNSISYGTSMTSKPQIKSRGLVFNTGKASDQIRLLKDFFRARGDTNVPWGYTYDDRTKSLVRNFQREKGLNPDGIAGQSTINEMNKEINNRKYGIGLRIPYADVKGDMLLINKSSNTIYLLVNGNIQESYPVATGKSASLTPSGQHKITTKAINPGWGGAGISEPISGGAPNNPLGTRWIGISYGGGWKYGVHGNSNPNSIGSYASLGCVRMFNEDVEKLYNRVKYGTPTWIGTEAELISYGVKFKSNLLASKPKPKPKPKQINLKLDGKNIELKDSIINKDGTTYHPFREILELVGGEVYWDDINRKAIGILGENYVEFAIDSNKYRHNDQEKFLPEGQKTFIRNSKTYIPIRNLMESVGYDVGWDQATGTVILNKIVKEPEPIEKLELEYETEEEPRLEEAIEVDETENIENEVEVKEDKINK